MIRVGLPQKYRPTKFSKLPKPQNFKPSKIINHMVYFIGRIQVKQKHNCNNPLVLSAKYMTLKVSCIHYICSLKGYLDSKYYCSEF